MAMASPISHLPRTATCTPVWDTATPVSDGLNRKGGPISQCQMQHLPVIVTTPVKTT
jgi:hypothetical protein